MTAIDIDSDLDNSAPELHKFNNPVTVCILIVTLELIIGGCLIALIGTLKAILTAAVLAGIGATMWVLGNTDHSSEKPREAGILTFWGTHFKIGGEHVVVGGRVILAPYFPFYIESDKVNMDNHEKKYDFNVVSKPDEEGGKPVPLMVQLKLIARANEHDLLDFIQAGNDFEKIWEQIETIAYKEVVMESRNHKPDTLISQPELISNALEVNAKAFLAKKFGIKLINVRAKVELPKELLEELKNIKKEDYQRSAELKEYETMDKAALKRQRKHAREQLVNPHPETPLTTEELDREIPRLVREGEIPDFEKCSEEVKTLRLIRDHHVIKIETSPNGSPIIFNSVDLAELLKKK